MLDELLGLLDAPRSALWNTAEGLSEGDFGKAAPGLLGLLSGGLAATGVGLPLAIALGSGVGGLGQTLFGQKATTPEELLGRMGMEEGTGRDIAGFALGAATDPLSFIGGGVGRSIGRMGGRELDDIAKLRGPAYQTTTDDFLRMAADPAAMVKDKAGLAQEGQQFADFIINQNSRGPISNGFLSEIPPQSKILGAGKEGMAFMTPTNDVVRVGPVAPDSLGRPVAESVLQPTRTIDKYMDIHSPMRVERLPFADVSGRMKTVDRSPGAMALSDLAKSEGLDFADRIPANWGTYQGKSKIIDPGAVFPTAGYAGEFSPVIPHTLPDLQRGLLERLFSRPGAMQRAVEQGLASPGYEQFYGNVGGLAGMAASQGF